MALPCCVALGWPQKSTMGASRDPARLYPHTLWSSRGGLRGNVAGLARTHTEAGGADGHRQGSSRSTGSAQAPHCTLNLAPTLRSPAGSVQPIAKCCQTAVQSA